MYHHYTVDPRAAGVSWRSALLLLDAQWRIMRGEADHSWALNVTLSGGECGRDRGPPRSTEFYSGAEG